MSVTRRLKRLLFAAAAGLAVAALPLAAAPRERSTTDPDRPEVLRAQMAAAAAKVQEFLKSKGRTTVAVGDFRPAGRGAVPGSAGPLYTRLLSGELKRLGVTVKLTDEYTVAGTYRAVRAKDAGGALGQDLALTVVDRDDAAVFRFDDFDAPASPATTAAVIGVTVNLDPAAKPGKPGDKPGPDTPSDRVENAITKPAVELHDKTRASAPNSPFEMELLVRAGGEGEAKPAPLVLDGGYAVAATLRPDDVYAVRLINRSDRDVAVRLGIDGLSMFDHSTARDADDRPVYQRVLVPAGKELVVKGWHLSNESTAEFLVKSYAPAGDAPAAQPVASAVGTVSAAFAYCWSAGDPVPDGDDGKSGHLHTALGRQVEQKYETKERVVGKDRAVVAVRYSR